MNNPGVQSLCMARPDFSRQSNKFLSNLIPKFYFYKVYKEDIFMHVN